MVLASILDDFFDDFPMFFASLFRHLFFMFFWSFPNRFLNRANHEIIKKPLVFIGLFALGTFRTQPIFRRISIQKTSNFRIVFSWNSWLFRHRFSHRFFHRFLMENDSKTEPKSIRRYDHFGSLFATFSEGRLFDAFWSPLGSLWAPFWLPLAPFWHPLAHFWRPLAPFWRHLAPFWHPLAHFWLTFGVFWLTFNISRSLFSYFYVLSMKMSCKIVFFFWKFLGTRFRKTPAD